MFVGDVDDGVLGKDHVETGVTKQQRAGFDVHKVNPVADACLARALTRRLQNRCLDVYAGDLRCAVFTDQQAIDTTGPATDVQYMLAGKVFALKQPGKLIGSAR